MTKEYYQLYELNEDIPEDVNELNYKILKCISEGTIESCHITKEEAKKYFSLVIKCEENE
jgi:hypothetical protein